MVLTIKEQSHSLLLDIMVRKDVLVLYFPPPVEVHCYIKLYYKPINDTTFELSVFWLSDNQKSGYQKAGSTT